MKNAIVVREKQFVNNKCGKAVKAWFKAADGMNKSTWAAAKTVYDITAFELWKDDFQTQKDLADFLGSSQSQISKMSRAYEYYTLAYTEDEDGNTTPILEGYTIAAVTAIMKVARCELLDFISKYNVSHETSSRAIAEYVKDYYNEDEVAEDDATEETTEETTETIEEVEVEVVGDDSEDTDNDIFNALVIIEKKANEIITGGNLTDNDIERIEKALNDLKILLV